MTEKRKVLIVDDDDAVSGALYNLIPSESFDVVRCDNGLTALDFASEKCFDVVITDYRMPGMNGVEITKSLRFKCPDSFIIGLSAENVERDFLAAGADAFVKKPFSPGKLLTMIENNK